jgi:ribosomal protein S18 acetylase RimI-like enzyme
MPKTLKEIRDEEDPARAHGEMLKQKHGAHTVDMFTNHQGHVHINNLIVHKEHRKQGVGSAIMRDINKYADENKKKVTLNVATKDDHHGTTSSSRLRKFYKSHGYVENKGRHKDFSFRASMYRDPK